MERPRMRVSATVLAAPDANALAAFYARLLGWTVTEDTPGWVRLRHPSGDLAPTGLSFNEEPGYVPPAWPAVPGEQQMMAQSRVRGVLHGNVAVADLADPGADPAAVTLTCSLQSAGSYDHSQPDDFTVSASGDGVAVVPPTPFSVPAPPPDEGPIAVCSRADVTDAGGGTTTYYFNSQNSTWITGSWATCTGAATCLELGPDCVWYLALLVELVEVADVTLCPVLASWSPGVPGVVDIDPTGDVYVAGVWVWDCPPYGS